MARKPGQSQRIVPEKAALSKLQIKRFSALTGTEESAVKGKNIINLREMFKFHLNPKFFLFEKICGKVVKKDPVTGEDLPVPFATVHIEDVDLNLLTYSPPGYPWVWHFPLFYRKEEIGNTKTDACGEFCAWVPRFDIDWILKWRKLHICYPIIFKRPRIDDYIQKRPPVRLPDPEPGPYIPDLPDPYRLHEVAGGIVPRVENELLRLRHLSASGRVSKNFEKVACRRLFEHELPPPLPKEFQQALTDERVQKSKKASAPEAIRNAVAQQTGLNVKSDILKGFNHQLFLGPFYRCFDIKLPVWHCILDVPDITFRVTQDINGDGIEEDIYNESFFDARWDSGPISDITLVANDNARESKICHVPDIPCSNVPAIFAGGLLPLNNASYFDPVAGYAIRTNRPKPVVPPRPDAQTPFCGTMGLFGCVDVQDAKYYRIEQSSDGGANYSAITWLAWNNYLNTNGLPIPITADTDGWYPVQPIHPTTGSPIPRSSLEHPTLICVWPSPALQQTVLRIELGNNAKAHMAYSAPVAIQSDNLPPTVYYIKWAWKYNWEPDTALRSLLGAPCPMIKRGAVPKEIQVVFQVDISAHHLREASITTSGCGGGNFIPELADPLNHPDHWHLSVLDNSVVLYQRYTLKADSLPGCYGFHTWATSRSINPAGMHSESLIPFPDWNVDEYFIYTNPVLSVAVVNEDL